MAPSKEIVHLFSGGTDSAYSATLLAGMFDKVRLVTYERLGFTHTENSKIYAGILMKKYGKDRITHTFINIDKEFKKLCFKNHFTDFLKYGFYVLINCGLCKLAMDWRTIVYCIDNNIKYVSTGSGKEMVFDPSQNIEIIKEVRDMYASFGIQYFAPGFEIPPNEREKELLRLGIANRLGIKGSAETWDYQPHCTQEYMNLFLIQYVCKKNRKFFSRQLTGSFYIPKEERFFEYHKKVCKFHKAKREEVKRYVQEYIDRKNKNIFRD